MKNQLKTILKFFFAFLLFASVLSCEDNDKIETENSSGKPVTEKDKNAKKPAIVNNYNKFSLSRSLSARKKLKKTVFFKGDVLTNSNKYISSFQNYTGLPTVNLFNSQDYAANNISLVGDYEVNYTYQNNLLTSAISTSLTQYPRSIINDIYVYDANGNLTGFSKYSVTGIEYNEDKTISKIKYGNYIDIFTYDSFKRIISVKFTGRVLLPGEVSWEHVYTYYGNNVYTKESKNKNGIVDVIHTYAYNPDLPGVFDKEPIRMIDNSHLHVVREEAFLVKDGAKTPFFISNPKYFYDEEGYLMMYDAGGLGNYSSINWFYYE